MPVTPRQEYAELKQVHERCASSTYCRVKVPPALVVSSSSSSDFHRANSVIAGRINVTNSLTLFPHSDCARRETDFLSSPLRLTRQISRNYCHSRALFDLFSINKFCQAFNTRCMILFLKNSLKLRFIATRY